MLDQVNRLRAKGLNVCYISSDLPSAERDVLIHNLLLDSPPYNFLSVTPESATSPEMEEIFSTMKLKKTLSIIVIDECHCIDMWGFDFRPAYGNLGHLSSFKCPLVAITGTCTTRTQGVILASLNISDATIVRQSCDRKNLSLHVKSKKADGKDQVAQLILDEYNGQCGIGMGIDKPDVRFVIHLSIPKSLECYAQEFGRAGRDEELPQCFIFFRFEDRTKHLHMISSLPEGDHRSLKLAELNDVVKMCLKPECRKLQLKKYFGEVSNDVCRSCDFCLDGACIEKTEANLQAVKVLNCLQSMIHVHPKMTFNLLVLVYRGSKQKEVLAKSFQNIPQYGKGKNIFSDSSLQHFIQMLISENVIAEKLRGTNEWGPHHF